MRKASALQIILGFGFRRRLRHFACTDASEDTVHTFDQPVVQAIALILAEEHIMERLPEFQVWLIDHRPVNVLRRRVGEVPAFAVEVRTKVVLPSLGAGFMPFVDLVLRHAW